MFYRLYFTVFVCIFSPLTLADTIWIKNGDIVSGEIKLIDSNKFIIKTQYAGEISIKSTDIKTFSTDNPSILKTDLYAKKLHIKKVIPSEQIGAALILDEKDEEQTISITRNLILIKENKNALLNEYLFNGQVRGGYAYDKGTKKTERYAFDTNFTMKHNLWRHNLVSTIRRTYKNDNVDTYYYGLQYNLDKFVTSQLFWQSSLQYRHDWIESIREKRSIGFGPGYQLWDNEQSQLSLALLLSYQGMFYQDNEESHHPLSSLRWNYQRYISGKSIRLFTDGSIGRSLNNSVSLEFEATAGAAYKITDWLELNSHVNKSKDKTRDGNNSNINYNIGIGVFW